MDFFSAVALAWAGQTILGEPLGREMPPPFVTFPIQMSIASGDPTEQGSDDGEAAERLRIQMDSAESLFGPFGVRFDRTPKERKLGARFVHVETRADRDAFAAELVPHVINVFVVASLRDVDNPSEMRRGVHWHGPSGSHYVILVSSAPPAVLAHELGHFFGNPHSKVTDNIMSYDRTGGWVFFDGDQGRRIVSHAHAYLETGELLPVLRR